MDESHASRVHSANTTLVAEGNLDAIPEFFAPGYVAHLTGRDLGGGHEGIRRFLSTLQGAFPDLQVEVEVLVEGDDRIAWAADSPRNAPRRVHGRPRVRAPSGMARHARNSIRGWSDR